MFKIESNPNVISLEAVCSRMMSAFPIPRTRVGGVPSLAPPALPGSLRSGTDGKGQRCRAPPPAPPGVRSPSSALLGSPRSASWQSQTWPGANSLPHRLKWYLGLFASVWPGFDVNTCLFKLVSHEWPRITWHVPLEAKQPKWTFRPDDIQSEVVRGAPGLVSARENRDQTRGDGRCVASPTHDRTRQAPPRLLARELVGKLHLKETGIEKALG